MKDGVISSYLTRFLGFEEKYFPRGMEGEAGYYISKYIRDSARFEVLSVAGELKPEFYESMHFKEGLLSLLRYSQNRIKNGTKAFKVISIKGRDEISRQNPFLAGLAKDKLIELYEVKVRPKYHFICIDERSLFLQEVHPPGEGAGTYFMEYTFKLAKEYKSRFLELTQKASRIEL